MLIFQGIWHVSLKTIHRNHCGRLFRLWISVDNVDILYSILLCTSSRTTHRILSPPSNTATTADVYTPQTGVKMMSPIWIETTVLLRNMVSNTLWYADQALRFSVSVIARILLSAKRDILIHDVNAVTQKARSALPHIFRYVMIVS